MARGVLWGSLVWRVWVLPAGKHFVPSRPEWDRLPLPAVRGRGLMPSFLPEPSPAKDPSREGRVRRAVSSSRLPGAGQSRAGGRAEPSRGSAPPARAAPLRGSPLPKPHKRPFSGPAAPHPGAAAGEPSGFAPPLRRGAEEERGTMGGRGGTGGPRPLRLP